MKTPKKKKRRPNKYQRLIGKFCKDPSSIWVNKGKVKAEMSVAKKLYAAYPSEGFWEKAFLSFKINTLRWFLTSDGKNFLRTESRKQTLDFGTKTNYNLTDKKIGKDKKVTRKIRTIKEFLKQDA